MRVDTSREKGQSRNAYDRLRAAGSPCVLLRLVANGGHHEPTGNELDEALLLPVSLFENLEARLRRLEERK